MNTKIRKTQIKRIYALNLFKEGNTYTEVRSKLKKRKYGNGVKKEI